MVGRLAGIGISKWPKVILQSKSKVSPKIAYFGLLFTLIYFKNFGIYFTLFYILGIYFTLIYFGNYMFYFGLHLEFGWYNLSKSDTA